MPIETLQDIIEELADALGIYGAHDERCVPERWKLCRACWASFMNRRLHEAIEVERKLWGE